MRICVHNKNSTLYRRETPFEGDARSVFFGRAREGNRIMRVITGSARGRKLRTVEGTDVRPTTERVKEALFSAIQFDIEGGMVLDLFCGSGQLGIEALSRGAKFAVFVDSSPESQEVTKQNLLATKLVQKARLVGRDWQSYLPGTPDRFDVAFLDPPYNKGIIGQVLPVLADKMNPGGIILCETEAPEPLPEKAGGFAIHKRYKYGRIAITMYRQQQPEEVDEA